MINLKRILTLLTLVTLAHHGHSALRCGSSLVNEGAWPIEVDIESRPGR